MSNTDNVNLENYNTSPRKYQEVRLEGVEGGAGGSGSPGAHSFDSYGGGERRSLRDFNRCCVSVGMGQKIPSQCPPAASVNVGGKLLCNAEVESRINAIGTLPDVTLAISGEMEMLPVELAKTRDHGQPGVTGIPDIANTSERKQPDGEEKAPEIVVTDHCESNAAGMLDRISHDLDYLLNRKHRKDEA